MMLSRGLRARFIVIRCYWRLLWSDHATLTSRVSCRQSVVCISG